MTEMSQAEERPQPLPILATKLYIPPLRPRLVSRRRLMARLDEGARRRLTLISAPAGFGKSTLLSEWVHVRMEGDDLPVAWLSLDAGDNDPMRFWAYFVGALQQLRQGLGQDALALLRAPQPPQSEALMTLLINDIAAFRQELVLVLDDYHVIEAQSIHDALTFLLDHMPPQMHLIVASRRDPPLPLALLRGRGQLVELRADDLRFTDEEAAAFLNQVMGLTLDAADIAALGSRTEGWVAGLQLAALSMQGVGDVSAFVQAFAGSHRYVVDYLAQEVLYRQPEPVRAFLLQTSLLERLSGPLCDALTGAAGGQTMLEGLERANLFIVALDQDRRWYRYHHLFGGYLQHRLEQTEGEHVPELHRRAAAWLAAHGLAEEAITHALAAEDFSDAADLIERTAEAVFLRSELGTLRSRIGRLPSHLLDERPRLAMIYTWAQLATGHFDAAAALLDRIERCLGATTDMLAEGAPGSGALSPEVRAGLGEVALVRASLHLNRMELEQTAKLSQRALDAFAETGLEWSLYNTTLALRGTAKFNLGLAYEFGGDVPAAVEAFAEAVSLSREAGNVYIVPMASSHRAQLLILQGCLREAYGTYEEALRLSGEMAGESAPLSGTAHAGMGDVLREWNDLEAAEAQLQRGVELGQQWGTWESLVGGYTGLARIRQAQGDTAGALALLDELAAAVRDLQVPWVYGMVATCRVRLQVASGDVSEAARWQESAGLSADDTPSYAREADYITLARVLVARGMAGEALPLLERLQQGTEAGGRHGRLIEVLVLLAEAHWALHHPAPALCALAQALALAEPEGYVRTFVDEGEALMEVLRSLRTKELRELTELEASGDQKGLRGLKGEGARRLWAYAGRLLAAYDSEARAASQRPSVPSVPSVRCRPASPSAPSSSPLVEPLSDRELQVLALIAAGRSNREIAEELVVSLNTVKTHIRNLYGKLGVSSRTQAVARGTELGLL